MSGQPRTAPTVHLIQDFAVRIDGEVTWARANGRTSHLEHRLRYGTPEEIVRDRLLTASVLSCYRELVWLGAKRRAEIVRALRIAERHAPEENDG